MFIKLTYPSQRSFLDPELTKDGKPYAPLRYKAIVKERYYISKAINTSYNDVGKITPRERQYIVDFIIEDRKKEKELIKQQTEELKNRR